MRGLKRFITILAALVAYVGCSKVNFEAVPSTTCTDANSQYGSGACVQTPDGYNTFNIQVNGGELDILFVDDNSGSMYVEQTKMADRFSTLLNAIHKMDYQMAIITTDVSASPNNPPDRFNGQGAFQDGKFLKFPDGSDILTKSSSNILQQFQETIKRPETLECDHSTSGCPSGDERGLFALNMALDRGHSRFFRANAHLAVVILSDEDVRSDGIGGQIDGTYEPQDYDRPETFISKIRTQLGESRSVSVHPVIIRPGDTACYDAQNSQGNGVKGFYGKMYAELAQPRDEWKQLSGIQDGTLGNICAGDYSSVLQNIGNQLRKTEEVLLDCAPISAEVTLESDPGKKINATIDGQRLILNPAVPSYETLNVSFKCSRH